MTTQTVDPRQTSTLRVTPTDSANGRRRLLATVLRVALVLLLLSAFVVPVGGCASGHPVMNVESSAIGGNLTLDEIQKRIIRTARRRNWRANPAGPGKVEALLQVRTHTARVMIEFDQQAYSIYYQDSTNLGYRDGRIHRNYNNWIQRLDADIRRDLAF